MAMSFAIPSLLPSSLITSFGSSSKSQTAVKVQAEERAELEDSYSFLQYHEASNADPSSATDAQTSSNSRRHSSLSVRQDSFWTYCGPSLAISTPSDLPNSFHDFADATFTGPVPDTFYAFLDFVRTFLAERGLSNYLLTVRATTPTTEYDRPRWHTDEFFFAGLKQGSGGLPGARLGQSVTYEGGGEDTTTSATAADNGTSWKMCTTLLGPSTLFIPLKHQSSARDLQHQARRAASTEHDCLSIRCVGCASAAEQVRDRLAQELAPYGVEAAGPGQCAFFRIGGDKGAVHSEPSMSGRNGDGESNTDGRIFINVVPGSEDELRCMMQKWGMQFPRQWWIGSNVVKKPVQTS